MTKGGNPPLERLVRRELVAEILAALTAAELVVAILRAEGMTDGEIGAFLGIDRSAVRQRMKRARRRIGWAVPEVVGMMKGRRRHG